MTSRETVSTLATTKPFVPPLLPQLSLPSTAQSTPQPPPRAAHLKELFGVTLDPVGRTYFSRSKLQCSQPLGHFQCVCPTDPTGTTPEPGITSLFYHRTIRKEQCTRNAVALAADNFWRDF